MRGEGGARGGREGGVRRVVFGVGVRLCGIGFLGSCSGPEGRALHDAAAGDAVVYDWGDRHAEMPAPLTQWLNRHAEDEDVAV